MKYFTIVFAILAFASCDNEKRYRCECSSIKGHTIYEYEGDYKEAVDGVPACEMAEDSIAVGNPNAGVQCYFYRLD